MESEGKPEIVVEVGVSLTCAKAAFDGAVLHVAMEAFGVSGLQARPEIPTWYGGIESALS